MKAVRIRIDARHSAKLIKGEPIAFKIPRNTEAVQIQLDRSIDSFNLAKCLDVFFNGRKA